MLLGLSSWKMMLLGNKIGRSVGRSSFGGKDQELSVSDMLCLKCLRHPSGNVVCCWMYESRIQKKFTRNVIY